MPSVPGSCDVVVVEGGQGGLAAGGYYLRRAGLDYVILDAQSQPGGAWRHGWDSLRLFSPAEYSPLPGVGDASAGGRGVPDRRVRRGLPAGLRTAGASAGGGHQRAAGLAALDHERREVGAGGIDGSGVSGGSGTDGTECCYALQDKVWVRGPGNAWEVYTVKADSDHLEKATESSCCTPATDKEPATVGATGTCC
ncbi:hypothetical protein [Micromonospora inyonensis]|uniref:hypothetical protein n=1 Tax=Micromonospora inyonensis TaxID=47866 RepID=UPI00316AD40F